MESIARNGQAALNLRIKSLQTLALELAASDLAERGLKPVSHSWRILPMQQVLSDLHSSNQFSYLGSLPITVVLAEAVLASIDALGQAGNDLPTVVRGVVDLAFREAWGAVLFRSAALRSTKRPPTPLVLRREF